MKKNRHCLAMLLIAMLLITRYTKAQTDHQDIAVSNEINTRAGEVHISCSKAYPGVLVVSSMTHKNTPGTNVSLPGTLTQDSRFVSKDYGQTWLGTEYTDPTTNYADPTSSFDAQGNAYLIQMAGNVANMGGGLSMQKCTNPLSNTPTWTAETPVYINSSMNISCDKEMMAIDNFPGSPNLNNAYVCWAGNSKLWFQKSTNITSSPATFSTPVWLGYYGRGPHIQTGPAGEVYIIWLPSGELNLGFGRSTDGGNSFSYLNNSAFPINSITGYNSKFHRAGNIVHNFPSIAVDKSCTPTSHRGRIYVTYPENVLTLPSFKSEIRFRYSDDQGSTWSSVKSINISSSYNCYQPFIAFDDATGIISVVYYSVDDNTTYSTNTYIAYSSDGGSTFNNLKVSDNSFIPDDTKMEGHYISIAAYGGISYPTWYQYDSTGIIPKVWVSPIKFSDPSYYSSTADLNINGPLTVSTISSSVNYNATNNISAPAISNTMNVPGGANVFFQAGNSISFVPGFSSDVGANILATIGTSTSCMSTVSRIVSSDFHNNKNIKTETSVDEIVVFPNPFIENLTFKYELQESMNVDIRLYDEEGKEIGIVLDNVKQEKGQREVFYTPPFLNNDFYLYIAKLGDKTFKGRLIKINKTDGDDEDFDD